MYQVSDYQENRAQLRARLIACGIPAALLLAAMLLSFFLRWSEAITVIVCILMCSLCVFAYSLFISPVIAYGKHIAHALNGYTRQTRGAFISMEDAPVPRDGVMFYPLTINVGDRDKDEDDRLFYLDANRPIPDWQEGDRLLITAYDKRITAWESDPEVS